MKTTKQIVSEHTYHLWDQGGAGPEVLIEEFWLAVKAEFDCIENPPWATEEAATARRTRSLLEDNPASG